MQHYKLKYRSMILFSNKTYQRRNAKIVIEFPGYGYRRFKVELRNRNHIVNKKKVRRFMKEEHGI